MQRTSIKKQKNKSYTMGMIFSIPSDADVITPLKTNNIDDYDTGFFTPEELNLAKKLMEDKGFEGQPKVVAIEDLDRNLLAIDMTIGAYKVTARQYSFGFSFGFRL